MKKTLVIGLAVVLGIGLIGYAVADPDHGRGRGMGSGPGWMHRGGGYGPGLMHRGSGYGPGWMHRGPGVGLGFNPCGQIPGKPAGETLTKEKAETLVKQQLARLGEGGKEAKNRPKISHGPGFVVPEAGFEPARAHVPGDFESPASPIPPLRHA